MIPVRVEHGRRAVLWEHAAAGSGRASWICGTRRAYAAPKAVIFCDHRMVRLDRYISQRTARWRAMSSNGSREPACIRLRSVSRRSRYVGFARPRARRRRRTRSGTYAVADAERPETPPRQSVVAGARVANVRNVPGAERSRVRFPSGQARAQGVASPLVEDNDVVAARPSARPRK